MKTRYTTEELKTALTIWTEYADSYWPDIDFVSFIEMSIKENDRIVKCSECGDKHIWKDRVSRKRGDWTLYLCPKCGEESYINIQQQTR